MSLSTNLPDSTFLRSGIVDQFKNNSFGALPLKQDFISTFSEQSGGIGMFTPSNMSQMMSTSNIQTNYAGTQTLFKSVEIDIMSEFTAGTDNKWKLYTIIALTLCEMMFFGIATFRDGGFKDDDKCISACVFTMAMMCYFNIITLCIIIKNKGLTGMVFVLYFAYSAISTIIATVTIIKQQFGENADVATGMGKVTFIGVWVAFIGLRMLACQRLYNGYAEAKKAVDSIRSAMAQYDQEFTNADHKDDDAVNMLCGRIQGKIDGILQNSSFFSGVSQGKRDELDAEVNGICEKLIAANKAKQSKG